MVRFKQDINVSARTRREALKQVRKFAGSVGMVAEKIKMKQRGTMRTKKGKVFSVSMILRTKKKRKR